ncbi:hypothetical protein Tco_0766478 [Tanacetum coccineum]
MTSVQLMASHTGGSKERNSTSTNTVNPQIVMQSDPICEFSVQHVDQKHCHQERIEDLQLGVESYQTKLNLEQPNWDASDFLFKEDYTIVNKPRAVIYRDMDDNKKIMRIDEVHKFSDGTLLRIRDKLDFMVKDFRLFKFNKDDKRRSEDFIEVIEKRLKIRRIFRSLESFVGGRLRDIDYRLISRTE